MFHRPAGLLNYVLCNLFSLLPHCKMLCPKTITQAVNVTGLLGLLRNKEYA